MKQRLIELVFEYQARVKEAVALFEKHQAVSKPMFWRQLGLPQTGYIDSSQSIRYYFHGGGCCVHLPTGPVDWDFGCDGRIEGFDAWRLWNFAESGSENFPEFKQKSLLDAAFNQAIEQRIICQPFRLQQDDLYYVREMIEQQGDDA